MSVGHATTRKTPVWISASLVVLAVIVGIVAVVYFVEPAHKLPGFFPGHTPHGTKARVKHGIAAAVVAGLLLVAAWFSAARKRTT